MSPPMSRSRSAAAATYRGPMTRSRSAAAANYGRPMTRSRTAAAANYGSPITRSHISSFAATRKQNTVKRKSFSGDRDGEKKKKKQATTSTNNKQIQNKPEENTKNSNTGLEQGESSESFTCGICFDYVTNSNMFTTSSCNHPFCTNCISKYVDAEREKNLVKVNCPKPECSVELIPENLQSFLPKNVIADWESAITESLKEKNYCPYNDCSVLLVNDGGLEGVTSCECHSCHRLFCAQCKVPWHADMNCREFQESRDEEELDRKFLELAKTEKWQRCPKCSMYVQKIEGCSSMECVDVTSATIVVVRLGFIDVCALNLDYNIHVLMTDDIWVRKLAWQICKKF